MTYSLCERLTSGRREGANGGRPLPAGSSSQGQIGHPHLGTTPAMDVQDDVPQENGLVAAPFPPLSVYLDAQSSEGEVIRESSGRMIPNQVGSGPCSHMCVPITDFLYIN